MENGEIKYAIEIPKALSILAYTDPSAEVIGLDQIKEEEIPPLYIHYLFDIMVSIGVWMTLLSFVYWLGMKRSWSFINSKWYHWLIVLGGPLSIVAIETGWWLAEVGRQPWILYGLMKTSDAATTSGHVDMMLILFAGLYLILAIGSAIVLSRMFRRNPVERELEERRAEKGGVVQ